MGAEEPSKRSRWTRTGAVIGVVASVVGIATGIKALLADEGSKESTSETRARQVRACERDHELAKAVEKRAPQPGETNILKPGPLADEFATFNQRTYATCDWPPPPGASPDGYRAITATTVDGPGQGEFTGSSYADRFESSCKVLALDYLFGFMGEFAPLPTVRGKPGQTLRLTYNLEGKKPQSDVEPWTPGQGEDRYLPFYPSRDELVVLHNEQAVLENVSCLS